LVVVVAKGQGFMERFHDFVSNVMVWFSWLSTLKRKINPKSYIG
jgi:hypothetical protein